MLKRIINNFLSEFYPNTSNILHFGSSRYDDKYNDIDLLILSNKSSNFTKEISENSKNQGDKDDLYDTAIEIIKSYDIRTGFAYFKTTNVSGSEIIDINFWNNYMQKYFFGINPILIPEL